MKILHVIPGLTYERGGPTAVVQALTRCQVAAGHTVAVLTTDQGWRHGERFADLAAGVELERLPVRGPDRVAYTPGFAAAVRRRLHNADVLHAHSLFTYPIHVTLREAAAVQFPLVLKPCGLLHPYSLGRSRWVKRVYLTAWGKLVRRACSRWHYTSEQEAADSWPPAPKPAFVLPNGVEPDDFALPRETAQAHVHQKWPQLEGQPYVLFLSRLHAKKRLDLLLDAFLAAAPSPYRLVVAGPDNGDLWETLCRRLLSKETAARRVLRVGPVRGVDKAALLVAADLFALPSEHENFGVAALEALAAGVPVLLSPHVDLAVQAQAQGVGFVAPLQRDAWREQLSNLLATPARLQALSDSARRWVAEQFRWDRLAAELTHHYEDILRERWQGYLAGNRLPMTPPVSCLIYTLNEEVNLPYCLGGLGWCDDVVVVDSFSNDATERISRDAGARFVQHAFTGFGDQRNWSLDHLELKHPWALILDADERTPPEMAAEMATRLPAAPLEVAAYRLRRRFYLWGRWLRFSSLYPTWVVRLLRVGRIRYVNRGHAETQEVDGRIEALQTDLIDENHKGLHDWWERQNRYSTQEALYELAQPAASWLELVARDPLRRRTALKGLARDLPGRPLWYFLYTFLARGGFLDGLDGWRFCRMKAMYQAMIVLKKHELRRARMIQ